MLHHILLLSAFLLPFKQKQFSLFGYAQGTSYKILYYSNKPRIAQNEIDSLFLALENSLSIYNPNSLISQFNREGIVTPDLHLLKVVLKGKEVNQMAQGYFDMTVLPLVEAWGFGIRPHQQPPDSSVIYVLNNCIGDSLIYFSFHQLLRKKDCVKLDVNGIAQGYSVDVLSDFLETKNIANYLIEIGGEIYARGNKPGNKEWIISIEQPGALEDNIVESYFSIENKAVTTSGNFRRYYESEGKLISHIIDPTTGFPVQNELISVTVCAKDAITADAFDNVFMVMGLQKSLEFLQHHHELGAYFIYKDEMGNIKDTAYNFLKPVAFD